MATEARWMRWLTNILGASFTLFLMVGLPLWVYLDGVGASCVNDPYGDPHCHQAVAPHNLVVAVLFGGIWWIGVVVSVVGWARRKVRRSRGTEPE